MSEKGSDGRRRPHSRGPIPETGGATKHQRSSVSSNLVNDSSPPWLNKSESFGCRLVTTVTVKGTNPTYCTYLSLQTGRVLQSHLLTIQHGAATSHMGPWFQPPPPFVGVCTNNGAGVHPTFGLCRTLLGAGQDAVHFQAWVDAVKDLAVPGTRVRWTLTRYGGCVWI